MVTKIEDMSQIDKQEAFSILLTEGLVGLKKYLEDKTNIEQEDIRSAASTLRKQFSKEMLFNFLVENSSSSKEDENVLLRKTKKGYVLQQSFLESALEGEPQQMLNNYFREKYQGFAAIKSMGSRPDEMKSKMIRYVISQLVGKEAFGQQKVETLSEVETQDKEESIERGESKLINDVLSNFKMKGKSTRYNLNNAENAPSRGVSWAASKFSERELKEWQRTLESVPTQNMRRLVEPFLNIIESRLTTESSIMFEGIELDADMLIGKLDLKYLTRREEIYKYWKNIDTKYEDVQRTVEEFARGLKEIKTDNKKLQEVIDEFNTVAEELSSNENDYKYIIEYDGKPMKDWVKGRDKVQVLFETFLDSLDEKGANVDIDRTREKLIEELGIDSDISDEDLGLEGRGLATRTSMTDKETGEKREFIEIDATKAKEENTQASRLGRKLGKLHETTKVDPLFYYVYAGENKNRTDSSVWAEWPIFSKEISRIKKQMKILGIKSVVEIDDDIEKYVDRLAEQAVVGMQEFYLPISERIFDSGILQTQDNDKIDEAKNIKNIGNFLEIVSKFLSSGSNLDRLASPTTVEQTGTKAQASPQMISATFGRQDRKNFLEEIEEITNEHEAMMEAIIEYYIVPLNSRYKPFDDKIEFANTQLMQILTKMKPNDNSFFTLLAMEAEYGGLLLDEDELKLITDTLQFITTPANKDFIDLRAKLIALQSKLVEILGQLGGNFDEDSKVELGAFLNGLLKKNKLNDVKIFNRYTEEWKELYNPQKIYPLEAIESHLNKNRGQYTENENTKSYIKNFFSAIDDMKIVKSEDEMKILDAHDTIRKMMNKPVYYNTSKLDNYTHVNRAIEILKENYHIDVSVNEIEQIVNKIDSMENISKTHGIPVESVYYLKANFR